MRFRGKLGDAKSARIIAVQSGFGAHAEFRLPVSAGGSGTRSMAWIFLSAFNCSKVFLALPLLGKKTEQNGFIRNIQM
jgi:hypothetical protein